MFLPEQDIGASPIFRSIIASIGKFLFIYIKPAWRNWQTRGTQNPVPLLECRFDPDRRYVMDLKGLSRTLYLILFI